MPLHYWPLFLATTDRTLFEKSNYWPKIQFWQNLTIFSGNRSCQQLKSVNSQHFHEFFAQICLTIFLVKSKLSTFHPKQFDTFYREIKVESLDKKWRFRTVWQKNYSFDYSYDMNKKSLSSSRGYMFSWETMILSTLLYSLAFNIVMLSTRPLWPLGLRGTSPQKTPDYCLLSSWHGVWKSQKKSHSTLRAKRATFTFWVDKS